MHHNDRPRFQHSGHAIVWLVGRRDAYEGDAVLDGATLTLDGHLRVVSGPDSAPRVDYRDRVLKTWPTRLLREVSWRLDEEAA